MYPVPAASAGVSAPMRPIDSMIEVTYAPPGTSENSITQTIGNSTAHSLIQASNQDVNRAQTPRSDGANSLRMMPTGKKIAVSVIHVCA